MGENILYFLNFFKIDIDHKRYNFDSCNINLQHPSQLITMVCSAAYGLRQIDGRRRARNASYSRLEKIELANKCILYGESSNKVSWQFDIKPDTFRKWVKAVKAGDMIYDSKGRPGSLSQNSKLALASYISSGPYNVREVDFIKKVHQLQIDDATPFTSSLSQVKPIGRRSIYRLRKELQLKSATAEATTFARAEAISSIRNAVSFILAMFIFRHVKPSLVINMDATQYTVGRSQKANTVIYDPETQKKKCLKTLPPEKGGFLMHMFIKYVHVITAGRRMGDPIFLIADDSMSEDDFDVQECPCLAIGTSLGSTAWITFSKTRCWNASGYRWFNTLILIPFVQRIKEFQRYPIDERSLFMLDGEPAQIKIYEDSGMQEAFKEHCIDIVKPSASTTEITQACDAGRDFLSSKATLKVIKDEEVEFSDRVPLVKAAFDSHNDYLSVQYPGQKAVFNSTHRKMAVIGLLKINMAQSQTFNPQNITDAFSKIGARPYSPSQILAQCTTPIDRALESTIMGSIEDLSLLMAAKGEVFDAEYETAGIKDNLNLPGKPKEDLVVPRRRTTVLTNVNFIARQNQVREDALTQLADAAAKKDAALEKRVAAVATAAARKVATAAKRIVAAAQKVHQRAMAAAKRIQQQNAREAKAAAKAARAAAKLAAVPPAI